MWEYAVRKLIQGNCYEELEELLKNREISIKLIGSLSKILQYALEKSHNSLIPVIFSVQDEEGETMIDTYEKIPIRLHNSIITAIHFQSDVMLSHIIYLKDEEGNYFIDFHRNNNEIVKALLELPKNPKIVEMIYHHPSFDKTLITENDIFKACMSWVFISLYKDQLDFMKNDYIYFRQILRDGKCTEIVSYILKDPKIDSFFEEKTFIYLAKEFLKIDAQNLICLCNDERMQPFFDNNETFYEMLEKISTGSVIFPIELFRLIHKRRKITFDTLLKLKPCFGFGNVYTKSPLKMFLSLPSVKKEIPKYIEEWVVSTYEKNHRVHHALMDTGYKWFPFEKHLPRWLNEYWSKNRSSMTLHLIYLCECMKKRKDKIIFPRDAFLFTLEDIEIMRNEIPGEWRPYLGYRIQLYTYMKEILSSVV